MKLLMTKTLLIAIFIIGSFGLAYAEEQQLPLEKIYDDKFCTFTAFTDYVQFTCNWKWLLPETVTSEINQTDIPELTSDLPQHNLDLADQIKLILEKAAKVKLQLELDSLEMNILR